ncbi:DNA polymerase IV [Nakamurella silvestris]|nr:DNA polymerase IV [Nakamurella silvestris]
MGRKAENRYVTHDIESVDDAECTILHADMDAFFAEVELRRQPELRGRPMMVAGGSRGVVLSATYEARRYGIRSAMPTRRAINLCPDVLVLPPNMADYREASTAVMAIFESVTPHVEQLSVDEAFLDVAGVRRISGRPGRIASDLRRRIADELGLPCTVGAAATKFMAKLASGLAKPNGLLIVPPGEVIDLLHPLPVAALWGVGPKTAEQLSRYGLQTIGELAALSPVELGRIVGPAAGAKMADLAWGRDPRAVTERAAESSMSADETFGVDSVSRDHQLRELLRLSDKLARRARVAGVRARTVAVRVRFDDFSTVQRSVTLGAATDVTREVYAAAVGQFDRLVTNGRPIRLLGVRLEQLVAEDEVEEQLQFGEEEGPSWREVDGAADRVTAKFGSAALRPASFLAAKPKTTPR